MITAGEKGEASLAVGAIVPYAIDYSQFTPRGHYTRNEKLKRYFRAIMWYGLFPFAPRYLDPLGKSHPSPQSARQALLLTHDLISANLQDTWDRLFTPINFFVGGVDDLTPGEMWAHIQSVYGKQPTLQHYADPERFEQFREGFEKLRMPQIRPKFEHIAGNLPPLPDPKVPQLRLLGQRYVPDSEILQELSHPTLRPMPSGLDVMAVLGSQRAAELLDALDDKGWDKYPKVRSELIKRFSALSQSEWTRNLYTSWLWVLKSLLQPFGEGYPMFMRQPAWQDKSLQTALGSWAQLRHDTILYVKQSLVAAEGGDEEPELPDFTGYVEPNLEAWNRLLALVRQTRELLVPRKLLSQQMTERLKELESMVEFLRNCAQKHLQNQRLSRDERDRLRYIGGEMDYLSLWLVSQGKASYWFELENSTDKNMACIADVHTAALATSAGMITTALEVGVGYADEIYVVVPDTGGRLYLARGAVFSYYEFPYDISSKPRLTDEEWQKMLGQGNLPAPQPQWITDLTAPNGIQIKQPPAP